MERLTFKAGGFNAFSSRCLSTYGGIQNDGSVTYIGGVADKLAEYEDLEEQGRLLKLPCAVGDTVYTNVSMQGWYSRKESRPYAAKVVFIGINDSDNIMNVDLGNGHMLQFRFSDIGKTVFLTREEAEAALKEL